MEDVVQESWDQLPLSCPYSNAGTTCPSTIDRKPSSEAKKVV